LAHFASKEAKKHAKITLRMLRKIAETREKWRETRISQALMYPNLRVQVTRKIMRLSGNSCVICGRNNHVAGDPLCMELAAYHMIDEQKKKKEKTKIQRSQSSHRIAYHERNSYIKAHDTVALALTAASSATQNHSTRQILSRSMSISRKKQSIKVLKEEMDDVEGKNASSIRLGKQLVAKQWKEAMKAGLGHPPRRPTEAMGIAMGITIDTNTTKGKLESSLMLSKLLSKKKMKDEREIDIHQEIQAIRESWPYHWHDPSEPHQSHGKLHYTPSTSSLDSNNNNTTKSPPRSPQTARIDRANPPKSAASASSAVREGFLTARV
jgi:hypothetical protein